MPLRCNHEETEITKIEIDPETPEIVNVELHCHYCDSDLDTYKVSQSDLIYWLQEEY